MEPDEIEKRIRHIHNVELALDESGEGYTPLTDALRQAIPYMTPEEIRETLFRTLDMVDRQWQEKQASKETCDKEREEHKLEVALLKNQLDLKDKALTEKDKALSESNRRIAELEKALAEKTAENVDANHRVESSNKDKFCGTSKRGIDKDKTTGKGRDDNKNDFDGTESSASPAESEHEASTKPETQTITREKKDIEKDQAKTRGKYTLADASEKIIYECDESLVPEGAQIIDHSEEVVFDEERIIKAYIYKMVTYRIKVKFINEDGHEDWRVEEHTVHMRRIRRDLNRRAGLESNLTRPQSSPENAGSDSNVTEEIVRYENGHMPGQITDTKVSARMMGMIIYQHLEAHIPVNRLTHVFDEFGLDINRSTVGGWIKKAASWMEAAYEKLLDQILADGAVCYCDETWERLHLKDITKKVYTWIVGNKKARAVAYHYDDGSRGRKVLVNLMEDRNIKALHTDGYTAYYYLQDLGIVLLGCNAHVWRKIKEWYELTGDPQARMLLLDLQWLYIQEADLKESGAPPEEVLLKRNSAETTEVIARFEARLELLKTKLDRLPKKGRTAVNYAVNMQSKLFRWREDADYELDNNFAERSARPVALSRKTSLHNGSHEGARVRAILRSFVETCKLEGISIVNYFTSFFEAVCGGRTDYENLLPATININATR